MRDEELSKEEQSSMTRQSVAPSIPASKAIVVRNLAGWKPTFNLYIRIQGLDGPVSFHIPVVKSVVRGGCITTIDLRNAEATKTYNPPLPLPLLSHSPNFKCILYSPEPPSHLYHILSLLPLSKSKNTKLY